MKFSGVFQTWLPAHDAPDGLQPSNSGDLNDPFFENFVGADKRISVPDASRRAECGGCGSHGLSNQLA